MDRLFLDANVLFSAAYHRHARLQRLWELGDVELITSTYACAEARVNLREIIQKERLEQLVHAMRIIASFANRPLPEGVSLPEKDRPILLAAIDARATHLLTGYFRDFGPYYAHMVEGVLILVESTNSNVPMHATLPVVSTWRGAASGTNRFLSGFKTLTLHTVLWLTSSLSLYWRSRSGGRHFIGRGATNGCVNVSYPLLACPCEF